MVRGPSSLMKKVELSEDQSPDALMEESSTSLAPTILYLTTFEAPATEESLILPVTSLWPQVRGWEGPWDDLM